MQSTRNSNQPPAFLCGLGHCARPAGSKLGSEGSLCSLPSLSSCVCLLSSSGTLTKQSVSRRLSPCQCDSCFPVMRFKGRRTVYRAVCLTTYGGNLKLNYMNQVPQQAIGNILVLGACLLLPFIDLIMSAIGYSEVHFASVTLHQLQTRLGKVLLFAVKRTYTSTSPPPSVSRCSGVHSGRSRDRVVPRKPHCILAGQ